MNKNQIITVLSAVCFLLTACNHTESTATEQTTISETQSQLETTIIQSTPVQTPVSNEPPSETNTQTEKEEHSESKTIEQTSQSVSEENIYVDEINELMKMDLMAISPDSSYEWPADGDKDFYTEAQSKYSNILKSFIDCPSNYELFGGAYFQNGYLHVMVTDMDKSEFILDTIGNENIIVKECNFSYSYLEQVKKYIASLDLKQEDGLNSYTVSIVKNNVIITVSNDDVKTYLYDIIEESGYNKDSVEINVTDAVVANPV